jgi:hypothetical protein
LEWAQLAVAFYASHLVGDYLLQTDRQARNKFGGLGRDPVARRALFAHLTTYILAFVPVLIWIGDELGLVAALVCALVIWLPHLVIDDGRLLRVYMRTVKRSESPSPELTAAVDQAMHFICLFAVALLASAW